MKTIIFIVLLPRTVLLLLAFIYSATIVGLTGLIGLFSGITTPNKIVEALIREAKATELQLVR
jgi:uncharacterized protein YqfA (UPF0365 family)